jgi:hypothetical protein
MVLINSRLAGTPCFRRDWLEPNETNTAAIRKAYIHVLSRRAGLSIRPLGNFRMARHPQSEANTGASRLLEMDNTLEYHREGDYGRCLLHL